MKLKSILTICFITTLLFGCVTTKYSNVNILENKNSMSEGRHAEAVWINKDKFKCNELFKILLDEVNIDNVSDEKGITRNEGKIVLAKVILNSQYNNGILLAKNPSPDYRMKLAITNMSPGDRASRIWAAELGFGHANVELQAIITNKQNERIIEIRDSRNHSGALGFRDNFEDSGPQLVRELLQETSDDILQELHLIKDTCKIR